MYPNPNYGPQTNDYMGQQQYPQMGQPYPQQANPPMVYFQPSQFIYVPDAMAELSNCTGVIIKQQPELFEAFTNCETANRYHVFGLSNLGQKYLFKCKENSSCLMRNCFLSSQREFDMDIIHLTSANQMTGFSKIFAKAFKPFKCTICCLCRPEMTVTLSDKNINVGVIKHVFTCLDPEFEIYDSNNRLKFIVSADCCQCGLLFSNSLFGKCSEATFEIYARGSKHVVGNIKKLVAHGAEFITDADSYQINFPSNADANDKLLLIALGLMIDYQYFESSPADEEKENNRRHGGYRGHRGYGGPRRRWN